MDDIKIAIQAVTSRREQVERVQERLPQAVAYYDTERRGPLWNMERIMRENGESDLLILQDDVAVPYWFEEEFHKAVMRDRVVSLFRGMIDYRGLWEEGYSYVQVDFIWGQANYYPSWFIQEYLRWAHDQPPMVPKNEHVEGKTRNASWDDWYVSEFANGRKIPMVLTIPSIVNHLIGPSELGHPIRVNGKERTATIFGRQWLREWDKTKIARKQ